MDGASAARAAAAAKVNKLLRQAISERLWLTALFLLLARPKIIEAILNSGNASFTAREKSPFIYDMR